MKKLQEPTISFIISYAMVPNDLSGFVGLLRHCPPLPLKRNDDGNELTWEWSWKKFQRKHLPMFCLLSTGRAWDWPLTCGCSSQSTAFAPTSWSSTSSPYRHTQRFRALQGLLVCDLPQESERRGARGCRPSPSARRSSPGCCRFVCDSHMHTMCLF